MRIASASGNVKHRFAIETHKPNTKTLQVEVFQRRNQFDSTPNRMFSFIAKVLSKTQNCFLFFDIRLNSSGFNDRFVLSPVSVTDRSFRD